MSKERSFKIGKRKMDCKKKVRRKPEREKWSRNKEYCTKGEIEHE